VVIWHTEPKVSKQAFLVNSDYLGVIWYRLFETKKLNVDGFGLNIFNFDVYKTSGAKNFPKKPSQKSRQNADNCANNRKQNLKQKSKN